MNGTMSADLSRTCGQQKFSGPTILSWLVCSERGWKNVKGHLVDQVSPEEGWEDEAACRWASLAEQSREEAAGRRRGGLLRHCTSQSVSLVLSIFYPSLF